MSILSMVESNLPPGFRFHPRDDELICDYLRRRVSAGADDAEFYGFPAMVDVNLNKCEPWDLPETACVRGKEWYFFSVKDKKYATGQRTNRATVSGYWKATGKDRHVLRKGVHVGMRKTLVFYQGRAPQGKKMEWVMHEFRMETSSSPNFSFKDQDWVLCKVFYKGRPRCRKISSAEACGEGEDGDGDGSSSLPPLMESRIADFNQAPLSLEQVPCFSSFSASQATPNHLSFSSLNAISCDKKSLEVVLSQLTNVEEENQHINECCFFESAIASLWNPFASV